MCIHYVQVHTCGHNTAVLVDTCPTSIKRGHECHYLDMSDSHSKITSENMSTNCPDCLKKEEEAKAKEQQKVNQGKTFSQRLMEEEERDKAIKKARKTLEALGSKIGELSVKEDKDEASEEAEAEDDHEGGYEGYRSRSGSSAIAIPIRKK